MDHPHLTQCDQGRGLSPCHVSSWSIQPFGHKRRGPKIGGCCAPCFLKGGAGSPSSTIWPMAWFEAYLRTTWRHDPFSRLATIDVGCGLYERRQNLRPSIRKWGLLYLFPSGEELAPHQTQCGWGRGLPACQVSS